MFLFCPGQHPLESTATFVTSKWFLFPSEAKELSWYLWPSLGIFNQMKSWLSLLPDHNFQCSTASSVKFKCMPANWDFYLPITQSNFDSPLVVHPVSMSDLFIIRLTPFFHECPDNLTWYVVGLSAAFCQHFSSVLVLLWHNQQQFQRLFVTVKCTFLLSAGNQLQTKDSPFLAMTKRFTFTLGIY